LHRLVEQHSEVVGRAHPRAHVRDEPIIAAAETDETRLDDRRVVEDLVGDTARTRGETTIAGTRGSKNFREIWPRSAVFVTICAGCLLPLNK
jgi:hypothetical protein